MRINLFSSLLFSSLLFSSLLFSSLLFSSLLFSSQIFFIVPSSHIISFHILLLCLSSCIFITSFYPHVWPLFSSYLYIYLYSVYFPSLPTPLPFSFSVSFNLCLCTYAQLMLTNSLHPVFPHTLRSWESWLLFVICHVSVFFHKSRRDMLCSPAERNLLSVCSAC